LRAGAGKQLSGLAAMLGLRQISFVDLLVSNTLASSPLGAVDADKSTFVRGDTVNFTVKLDPTKVEFPPALGPYNVKQIVLVRRIDITTQQEVARVSAASGQTEFKIPVIADNNGRTDEFFAFVVTTLAPVDLLALELGRASPAIAPQAGDYFGTLTDIQRGKPPRTPSDVEMTVKGLGGRDVTVTVFRRVFDFFGVEKAPFVLYNGSGTIAEDGSLQIGKPDDPEFYGTFSDDAFNGFIDTDGAAEVDLYRLEVRRK
jgi:hypothetical protein